MVVEVCMHAVQVEVPCLSSDAYAVTIWHIFMGAKVGPELSVHTDVKSANE